MGKKILTGFIFIVIAVVSLGQDISFPELEGFKKSTQYPVYTNTDLWSFIDGAADAYVALGFIDLHVIEYKKGKETIKLEIYRHSDHTMAFGMRQNDLLPSGLSAWVHRDILQAALLIFSKEITM